MAVDRDKVAKNALRFIQRGQFKRAIDEYKKVLATDPRDIRIRLKLIDLYGRAGRTQEAIDECLQVAETYADQGFNLKAIAVYKQALRIDPDNPLLYRNMGEMYVRQGLVGDALGSFKRGVDVLRRSGRGQEAEGILVRMEEMAPENIAIKVHLTELYLEDGNYEGFEEELGKVILQLRGEGRSRRLLQTVETFYEKSQHHPTVLKRLAELYVDLGAEEKALEVIREGLSTAPADRDLRLLGLRANLVLGQLPEARRMALGLYEEDPDDLFILEQLASIAQARGDHAELVQTYKAMAKVYARKGLGQKEDAYFRKVLEIDPDDAEARLALGELMAEPPAAPDDTIPGLDLGWGEEEPGKDAAGALGEGLMEAELYLKYGIEDKAEEKLRELVESAPSDVEIRQKLRDLYQRRGDRAGWVREQIQIAEIFLRERRETEALRAYQAVLEIDPGNENARKGVQYIKPDAAFAAPAGAVEIELTGGMIELEEVAGADRLVQRTPEPPAEAPQEALRDGLAEADFYEAQGLVDEARKTLLRLRDQFPDSPHVASRLARLDQEAAAEVEGDGFVDLQAEVLDDAALSLGSAFEGFADFEVSELDDIVKEFKSGIAERLEEEDYDTHYNLGMAYREMGLLDDAIEAFQLATQAPERAREAYTSLRNLAAVLGRRGKLAEARSALHLALTVPGNTDPDRAAIYYEIGTVSEQDGDREEALQAYQRVAEIEPGHRDVQTRIRKLQAGSPGA